MRKTWWVVLSVFYGMQAWASLVSEAIDKEDVVAARKLIQGQNANDMYDAPRGYTLLHRAVEVGNLDIVQLLVSHGAVIKAVDGNGNTPLHIAAEKGRPQTIKFLLKQGAAIDAENNEHMTPVLLAAREGRLGALEVLLDAAKDESVTDQGETPLHLAVANGHRKLVEVILRHKVNLNATNQQAHTPLHDAIQAGNVGIAELLLANGASLATATSEEGYYEGPIPPEPLALALIGGKKEMIKLLLDRGVEVKAEHLYTFDKNDYSRTECKPTSNYIHQVITRPREGAGPVNMGGSAFAQAMMCRDKALLEAMMKRTRDIPYGVVAGEMGRYTRSMALDTSLFEMLFAGDKELARDATTIFDEYANAIYYEEMSAAAGQGKPPGDFRVLEFMLAKGADPSHADESGDTMLHRVAEISGRRLAKFLLDHGAKVNAATKLGNTPLFRAVLSGNVEMVKLLLERGADVNVANEAGNTPLHFAAARNMKDVVTLLVKKGAKVNMANKDGNTPLHQAVRFPATFETASWLIKNGAKINAANRAGDTPLHCAALRDVGADNAQGSQQNMTYMYWQRPAEEKARDGALQEVVTELVKYKADVRARDNKGKTAFDLAQSNKAHPALAALLEPPPAPKAQGRKK